MSRWHRLRSGLCELGLKNGLMYCFGKYYGDKVSGFSIQPRLVPYPLYVRSRTSDLTVFRQIFLDQEYAPLYGLIDVRLIIDCGANVGYSSACFLTRFSSCKVIAVEPDPGNFEMLQRNLSKYGDRVSMVRAGIWSHATRLVVSKGTYRDGREWTIQVRPCEHDETADAEGVSIETLLAGSGHERISILKIDIEGAEAVIFRNAVGWLDKVDAIAIELHDDSFFGKASEIFFSAMQGRGFEILHSGELTVCRRFV